MKKCFKCKAGKPIEEFIKIKSSSDGRYSYCKACQKQYRETKREETAIYNKQYVQTNKEKLTVQYKQYRQKIKKTVFDHYGSCQCCGEDNRYFLTIDHTNNDGAEHRKKVSYWSGSAFYRWIINNNFPKDLQSYCFNCNMAKQTSGLGYCPHKQQKRRPIVGSP